ncbi:MAG: YeeE/YedE family protein [Nevskia sp.]
MNRASSLVALLAGAVFGFGLSLSGMTDPAKVLGFLDLAGAWQPTLAFVMGGGLLVTLPAFALIRRRRAAPVFEGMFHLPTRQDLDARLLLGATAFGIGWGIAGYCPGPAVASLASGSPVIVAFCVAMALGMALADRVAPKAA